MRILVYGAGVLGSLYAAKLHESGQDVSILARGERLAQVREHGIVLINEETGEQTTTHVNVVEQLAPDDAYDWVLVIMRKNQVADILPALAANRQTPNVLFMLNNASGPQSLIEALGRERVLLGFPAAGGARAGQVVRFRIVSGKGMPTTVGELDGRTTPRLEQMVAALTKAGFPAAISPNMDAWLKTHVAVVSPLANALYLAGGDNYRLARTRDGIVLLIRAVRENLRVLRALGIPVMPPLYRYLLEWPPEPLLVAVLQRRLNTQVVELMAARHANAARDEMQELANEFAELARQSNVPTPANDRLRTYLNAAVPPLPEGTNFLALDWSTVWLGAGLVAGLLALGRPRNRRRA